MCHKFRVSKNFMLKRVMSRFLSNFLSHKANKLRRGTLLCCVSEDFVAKNFTDKRGGGYQDFPSNFFLSRSTETFQRGNLLCCVSENLW